MKHVISKRQLLRLNFYQILFIYRTPPPKKNPSPPPNTHKPPPPPKPVNEIKH